MNREEAERLVDDIVDRAMECQQYEHLHNLKAAESARMKNGMFVYSLADCIRDGAVFTKEGE